jgi:PAS domain-containing protein
MKSEVTATESGRRTGMLSPRVELSPSAGTLPSAGEDESAAKYLFKLSRDVILSLDRSGNILCINRRGVQLSGYSETELRGANIFERLLLPEDRTAVDQILYDLVQGKRANMRFGGEPKTAPLFILMAFPFHGSQKTADFCPRFALCGT